MLNRFVLFFFPLLGAVGFLVRTMQLRSSLDASLPVPGSGVPTAVTVCVILAAAALVSLRLPKTAPDPPSALRPTAPKAAMGAAAVLTALMGVLLLMEGSGKVDTLLAVSALFTAFFFLLPLHPGSGQAMHIFCRMEGALFYTAFLIVYFSRHISDPAVSAFYPPLLALCAAALSFCELSGAACGRFRPRRLILFLCAGCSLNLLAAADFCTLAGAPYACGLLAAGAVQCGLDQRVLRWQLRPQGPVYPDM